MPFLIFQRDHLRSTSGVIFGLGSFAVQFGDHFRSGDHLRSGIICGAVQCYSFFLLLRSFLNISVIKKLKQVYLWDGTQDRDRG